MRNVRLTMAVGICLCHLSLQATSQGQQVVLRKTLKQTGTDFCVAFSPDGTTLASGGINKVIVLRDVTTGKELQKFSGHSDSITSVAFTPDGKTLVSASSDNTVGLWDVATGKLIRSLTGHKRAVSSVAVTSDGGAVASGSSDRTIKLWQVATGKELLTFSGHTGSINCVAFAPDGKTFASGSFAVVPHAEIKIWRIDNTSSLATLPGDGSSVNCIAFTADGTLVAAGGRDKLIKLVDTSSHRFKGALAGHKLWVTCAAFSPDGTLASGGHKMRPSLGGELKLWNVASRKQLIAVDGINSPVFSVAFNPTGTVLVAVLMDELRLWDVHGAHPQ